MPPTVPGLDILRQRLRSKLGNPDAQVISDADLDTFLEDALTAINDKLPGIARSSFDTVADQSTYHVLPAAGLRFTKVYMRPQGLRGVNFGDDIIFARLDLTGTEFTHGADVFENPATVEAFFKKQTAFANSFESKAYWWAPDDGQSVTLYPTPQSVCTVYFDYTVLRFATIEAVEKRYERALMLWAYAVGLEALANQRSNVVSGTSIGGSFTVGGGRLQAQMASEAKERFDGEFGNIPIGPSWSR